MKNLILLILIFFVFFAFKPIYSQNSIRELDECDLFAHAPLGIELESPDLVFAINRVKGSVVCFKKVNNMYMGNHIYGDIEEMPKYDYNTYDYNDYAIRYVGGSSHLHEQQRWICYPGDLGILESFLFTKMSIKGRESFLMKLNRKIYNPVLSHKRFTLSRQDSRLSFSMTFEVRQKETKIQNFCDTKFSHITNLQINNVHIYVHSYCFDQYGRLHIVTNAGTLVLENLSDGFQFHPQKHFMEISEKFFKK